MADKTGSKIDRLIDQIDAELNSWSPTGYENGLDIQSARNAELDLFRQVFTPDALRQNAEPETGVGFDDLVSIFGDPAYFSIKLSQISHLREDKYERLRSFLTKALALGSEVVYHHSNFVDDSSYGKRLLDDFEQFLISFPDHKLTQKNVLRMRSYMQQRDGGRIATLDQRVRDELISRTNESFHDRYGKRPIAGEEHGIENYTDITVRRISELGANDFCCALYFVNTVFNEITEENIIKTEKVRRNSTGLSKEQEKAYQSILDHLIAKTNNWLTEKYALIEKGKNSQTKLEIDNIQRDYQRYMQIITSFARELTSLIKKVKPPYLDILMQPDNVDFWLEPGSLLREPDECFSYFQERVQQLSDSLPKVFDPECWPSDATCKRNYTPEGMSEALKEHVHFLFKVQRVDIDTFVNGEKGLLKLMVEAKNAREEGLVLCSIFRLNDYSIQRYLDGGALKKTFEGVNILRDDGKRYCIKFYVPTKKGRDILDVRRQTLTDSVWCENRVRTDKINNPNINVIEHAHTDNLLDLYVTIEALCKGCVRDVDEDLSQGRPTPYERAVRFMQNIVNGLYGLREIGIIHLDLKIPNILVGYDGQLKLTDFGQSPSLLELSRLAGLDNAGYPSTMAPELLCSDNPPNQKVDVWSTSCIAYQFLTGEELFSMNFNGTEKEWKELPLRERITKYDRRVKDTIIFLGQQGINAKVDDLLCDVAMKQILRGCLTIDIERRYDLDRLKSEIDALYKKIAPNQKG